MGDRRERKRQAKELRRGRTIAAEREPAETESERIQARRKVHRRKTSALITVLLMAMVLGLGGYLGMEELSREQRALEEENSEKQKVQIIAQVVDEDNRGEISRRVQEYIAQLEGDFRDLGYTVTKVTLPKGLSRELFVDLEGKEGMYFKVNIDRGTAVSVEDAVRMIRYLDEHDIHPGYVDIRVAGRAYYK